MSEIKDLTGQRFGRLTVIKDTKKRQYGNVIWLVKCDCGKEKEVASNCLVKGLTSSCGCIRAEHYKDLLGRRFGRLTVTEKTSKRINRAIVWKAKCDCGSNYEIDSFNLLKGHTKSCGCLHAETSTKNLSEFTKKNSYSGTRICLIVREKPNSNNKSGFRGVYWDKRRGSWCAEIMLRKKKIRLGYYKDIADAIKSRKCAEDEYFIPIIDDYKKTNADSEKYIPDE